ncbi:MAG: metallophosphoesterase [Treponema sp.]|jgi:3',5'-cyclic AMP phosphodiesterase CpdA|nr:metallophosphoesterase [Treponema sp.]
MIDVLLLFCLLMSSCHRDNPLSIKESLPIVENPLFFISNDVHLFGKTLHDNGERYQQVLNGRDGKNIAMIDPLLQTLIAQAYKQHPDVVLFNGDLTYNGEKESHRELASRLYELEQTGTKVYVIPGNHDINNPWARAFYGDKALYTDSLNPEEFAAMYKDFGFSEALSRDRATLSYVAAPAANIRILMLDSAQYYHNRELGFPEVGGAIPESTRKWIVNVFAEARRSEAQVLVAMHHSLIDHNAMINRGFTVEDAELLQTVCAESSIPFVLSGHIHAQNISKKDTKAGTIYDIATSALSVYPHHIGVLQLVDNTRWQYTVQTLDVDSWAQATNQTDIQLLNFSHYAQQYFRKTAHGMVLRGIDDSNQLSAEELYSLIDLVSTVNERYFSGLQHLNATDVFDMPGYAVLQKQESGFLARYVLNVMEDSGINNINFTAVLLGTDL